MNGSLKYELFLRLDTDKKDHDDSMLGKPDRSAKLARVRPPSDGRSLRDRWFGIGAASARACDQGAKKTAAVKADQISNIETPAFEITRRAAESMIMGRTMWLR